MSTVLLPHWSVPFYLIYIGERKKKSQLVSKSILLTLIDNVSESDMTHTHTKKKGRWMEGQVFSKGPEEFDKTSHIIPALKVRVSRESSDRG